jgi:hypothetical protein
MSIKPADVFQPTVAIEQYLDGLLGSSHISLSHSPGTQSAGHSRSGSALAATLVQDSDSVDPHS